MVRKHVKWIRRPIALLVGLKQGRPGQIKWPMQ